MSGLEAMLGGVGKAVAQRAVGAWLAGRTGQQERDAELKDLIRSSFRDHVARRKFENQVQGIALAVEERLTALMAHEYRGLTDDAKAAVLHEVIHSLRSTDLSDAALFAADGDPVRLTEQVTAGLRPPGMGQAEDRLHAALLAECVECTVRMIQQLPQFLPRTAAETLGRLSGLADQVERLLARIPPRTLDAPEGSQDDQAFERRYLDFVSRTLDEVELPGVRVETYRPRTSLSVSYISLTVSAGDKEWRKASTRMPLDSLTGHATPEAGTPRVESALGQSRLTLVRGEAGSGKSTLLRWLAVTAARGAFSGALSSWAGCVPLLVKLRSHADGVLPTPELLISDIAQELSGRMPRGWVERILESGRGLLLVDGVDELQVKHRPAVRRWVARMLAAYPSARVVVTSRPAAADSRWLADEGFLSVLLEPMTPADLRELVRQWHVAMRDCPSLPCRPDELETCERSLLAQLESRGHLRALASTPLLAAMLCALNLDRRHQLPPSRMGLYRAVLDMLLERRDAERGIEDEVVLDQDQKVWILRDLAWRVVSMGRSELSKGTALRRIDQRLTSMVRMPYSPETVLDHLLRRSGILREPVPGRIDFVHRTVQDYLAAEQLVDDDDVEAAVEKAHLDQWREVVMMAAGHATGRLRRELLTGLMNRADEEKRYTRRLRLVVAACLETMQEIPAQVSDRYEQCLAAVIPPRNEDEARILSGAGEEMLKRLPDDLSQLTETQACMTVRTAWMINGRRALAKMALWGSAVNGPIISELLTGWKYYDAADYCKTVLSTTSVSDVVIDDLRLLRGVPHLPDLTTLQIHADDPVRDLTFLRALPKLEVLLINLLNVETLDDLATTPFLSYLWCQNEQYDSLDITALSRLHNLSELVLWNVRLDDFLFLEGFTKLRSLGLTLPTGDLDLDLLSGRKGLRQLYLQGENVAIDPAQFAGMPTLQHLALMSNGPIVGGLPSLAENQPSLHSLQLVEMSQLGSITALEPLRLNYLGLNSCTGIEDLDQIGRLQTLTQLSLANMPLEDLTQIASLPQLKRLDLTATDHALDLVPFAQKPGLQIIARKGTEVVNEHLLHPQSSLHRLPTD
ncbi:NACHT domain-containing protein [Herbidospora cretacea]|uniref:NACHT domain-containing protein n=1 Tax=Herbidospora cretacea TaxID=28444 RepID=UPI0018CC4BF3|nr:NACHT domain-containing protein [Herbidospora cretacea]